MNESPHNELDRLLLEWSESCAVNVNQLDALRLRVDARLASEATQSAAVERLPRQTNRSKRRVLAALAIAATMLAAVAWWSGYAPPKDADPQLALTMQDPQPELLGPRLEDKKQILAEYRELFGTNFAWLVEQRNRTEIGLRSSGFAEPPTSGEFVIVRLVLLARPVHRGNWNEVQNVEVVSRREEFVEVLPTADSSASLVMWAYPLDDGMISIDMHYEPRKFADRSLMVEGLSFESSGVQPIGKSTRVQSFVRGGVEYRLYQSADVVRDNFVG